MNPQANTDPRPALPRQSFGDRVAIVNQLLGGRLSRTQACRQFSLDERELERWIAAHARDRPVSLDEFRRPPTAAPGLRQLLTHLQQLESLLRARQRELLLLRQIARGRGLL